MTSKLLASLLALAIAVPAFAQSARQHVETLASDRFAGRQAGTEGERLAADYIQAQLRRAGVQPLAGRSDLFMPFEFTAGSRDGGSWLALDATTSRPAATFQSAADVQAMSFSDDAEVRGEVVFAGYGIVVPESQNFGYDSFATLDVRDKVVVVLRYFPEDADQQTRAILARYSGLRYKAMAARQRGARALLVVTGPRSPNAGQTIPMTFDTALAGSGIPAASISARVFERLMDAVAVDGGVRAKPLAEIQREFDSGNPHTAGFQLPGVSLTLHTRVVREKQTARNVVGVLPATAPTNGVDKPWILVGAHYDHLGRGTQGTSLATQAESGQIHNGADDNASGAAAVIVLAETLARQPRRRNLIVALWSGEEIGLVGSAAFAAAPPVPLTELAAALNFDMVGRMQDNKLIAQATGTSPLWARLLERANVAAGFDLTVQPDPYQPTDIATFNQAGVPSLSLTTGPHPDYHKPSDDADRIAFDDLDRIVAFAASVLRAADALEEAPQFTKVDQPTGRAGSIAGVRVTTGTIPDYATDVKGLLLGGVIGGGPAEKAGLMKGDVIVEIAGQTIANIYDYTYALELLKADVAVKVVFMRGSERRETELTPTARQ